VTGGSVELSEVIETLSTVCIHQPSEAFNSDAARAVDLRVQTATMS
jgi:hypothetical protein